MGQTGPEKVIKTEKEPGQRPEVSVIVPVYRVEKWLPQCLDSLTAQTLQETEIILIDDGSPDGCGALCDEYVKKDARIRVIHQENRGLSLARNAGLDAARGRYIMFADSDDWVEPDFCETPFRLAEETGADLVLFRHRRHEKDRQSVFPRFPDAQGSLTPQDAIEKVLFREGGISVWNKLYRRPVLDGVRFEAGRSFEDIGFTHRAFIRAGNIVYTEAVLYNYRIRPDSISNTRRLKTWTDRFELMLQQCADLEEFGMPADLIGRRRTKAALNYVKTAAPSKTPAYLQAKAVLKESKQPPLDGGMLYRLLYYSWKYARPVFHLICMMTGRRAKE